MQPDGGLPDGGQPYRELLLVPQEHRFGGVALGASAVAELVLKNRGDVPTGLLDVTLEGETGAYSITRNDCGGGPLGTEAECSIEVEFKPQARGKVTATVRVKDSHGPEVSSLLTGAGGAPPDEVLLAAPKFLLLGDCVPLSIEALDDAGQPVAVLAPIPLSLQVEGDAQEVGLYAAEDEHCEGTPQNDWVLESGEERVAFRIRSLQRDQVRVTGTGQGQHQPYTWEVILPVAAQARSQSCPFASGATVTTTTPHHPGCALVPPVDPGRTLLLYQAAGKDFSFGPSTIRCRLLPDGGAVECDRAVGGAPVDVQVWLLERPRGLRVQHLEWACEDVERFATSFAAGTVSMHPYLEAPVDPDRAFPLFGMKGPGALSSPAVDDLRAVSIEPDGGVSLTVTSAGPACIIPQAFALQVVEMDEAQVTSGVTALDSDDGERTVTGLASPEALLLYSWRVAHGVDVGTCQMALNAEVTSGMIRFSRGCTGVGVPEVRYQVVQLPPWAELSRATVTATGDEVVVQPATLPLKPDHVVFAGGQPGPGGQTFGASDAGVGGTASNFPPGVAQMRFSTTAELGSYRLDAQREYESGGAAAEVQVLSISPD